MFFGLRKIAPLGTYLPRCKVKDLPLRVPPLTFPLERQGQNNRCSILPNPKLLCSKTNNRPRYSVHVARDTDNGKAFYTRIGSAFEIKEGKGLSIVLEAHPIGDRMLLFPIVEKPASEAGSHTVSRFST